MCPETKAVLKKMNLLLRITVPSVVRLSHLPSAAIFLELEELDKMVRALDHAEK